MAKLMKTVLASFCLSLLAAQICGAAPTAVSVSGRQLLVSGKAFEMRGVTYGSPPVGLGWSFDWSATPDSYNVDFPLLKAMGCNTIRLYNEPTSALAMDAAYNHGLYVVMGYDPAWGQDYTNAAVRAAIKANFLNMVNNWKNHPAVLLWALGNENNSPSGQALTDANAVGWYSLVNECAQAAHVAEGAGYHPVTTAIAEISDIGKAARGASDADMPDVDLWAVQIYRGPSFYTLFAEFAAKSAKPMIISEFGVDSYNYITKKEDQADQAATLKAFWLEIVNNLSSRDSSKTCVGGTIHMFADDWSRNQNGVPNAVHDTEGTGHADNYYDAINTDKNQKNWQDEWVGLVSATPGTYAKTPKQAYYELKNLWTGVAATLGTGNAVGSLFKTAVKNYPNPFNRDNNGTRLEIDLNTACRVSVEIYDIAGNVLRSDDIGAVNSYSYYWDGKDDSGHTVAPGVYVARIKAEGSGKSEYAERKIVAIK
jgi:beta-galactosidase/beta-glucuronidase